MTEGEKLTDIFTAKTRFLLIFLLLLMGLRAFYDVDTKLYSALLFFVAIYILLNYILDRGLLKIKDKEND